MILPKVSVVILNWNGWKDTIECLESLYQIDYPSYDVIVVDNNSEDDSIKRIEDYADGLIKPKSKFFEYNSQNKPIRVFRHSELYLESENYILNQSSESISIIKNDSNYGYAKGNNIGANFAFRNSKTDYILFLNNDVVVDKKFLMKMIKFAEKNDSVGVIGPKVYYYDFPEKIQVTYTKMNYWRGTSYLVGDGEIDIGQYNEIKETEFVPGSCFLVKSEVIDKIGLFNPKYKCYWEEFDFCMSARAVGYKCIYYPDAKVWHKVSKSTNKIPGILTYYMTRNMFFFMKKHSKRYNYAIFLLFFFGLRFWYINFTFLRKNEYKNLSYFFKGVKDGVG